MIFHFQTGDVQVPSASSRVYYVIVTFITSGFHLCSVSQSKPFIEKETDNPVVQVYQEVMQNRSTTALP